MKLRNVLIGLVAMLPLALLPTPAHAGGRPIPLRCGMVIREDARLYLQKNLYCPRGPAVQIDDPDPEDDHVPLVIVDLRGHTLRGSGTATDLGGDGFANRGITSWSGANVRLSNGRVENWFIAVASWGEVTVKSVKFVQNDHGVVCDFNPWVGVGGRCDVDFSYFRDHSYVGASFERGATASVRHSIFSRNEVGLVAWDTSLDVQHSIFYKNSSGADIVRGGASFSYSKFFKNQTALRVSRDPEQPCPIGLYKTKLVKNGTDIDFWEGVTC